LLGACFLEAVNSRLSVSVQLAQNPNIMRSSHAACKQEGAWAEEVKVVVVGE